MVELVYTLVQAVHNLGAVAVVGSSAVGLGLRGRAAAVERRLAWLLLAAWGVQAATGTGFAAVSYGFKGQLPEVAGVALAALGVKIGATVLGLVLAAVQLSAGRRAGPRQRAANWAAGLVLAVSAVTAAAVLRWFL